MTEQPIRLVLIDDHGLCRRGEGQQTAGNEEMPRSFAEAFELEYARVRGDLRQKRTT